MSKDVEYMKGNVIRVTPSKVVRQLVFLDVSRLAPISPCSFPVFQKHKYRETSTSSLFAYAAKVQNLLALSSTCPP
eukprot:20764_3